MKQHQALIILAKYPHPDHVKTRLRRRLPDDARIVLYRNLLVDTIEKLKKLEGADTFISFAPRSEKKYFSAFGIPLLPQSEGDLGDRMFSAIQSVLQTGYQKAVLVGVDIPELSGGIVLKAFSLLEASDLVFGPAEDGGYYLVGMKKPIREIFTGITWSTGDTLTESIHKAESSGYRVSLTDLLYDIDRPEDLKRSGLCPNHD